MIGHDKTDPADKETAIAKMMDYIRGGGDLVSLYDTYPDLEFTDMEKALKAELKTVTVKDRTIFHYKLALLRSLRYAVASSKRCKVLGEVNSIREQYEGARLVQPIFETD